jgi:PAS domain S-box-containing protein
MAELRAENEALRAENAMLQSIKGALQESEERYRRFFEDDLTGDFVTAADGRILACNPAFVRIFGFASVEEALNTNIRDLYEDPEDRDRLLARLRREGKVENQGRVRRRGDGTLIHVIENVVGRFDADGELIEAQGYIYDDSERKRAEDALRESEERFRAVLENSLDAAYRRNLQIDRYDYMSPVIEQILGFTPEEMAAMGIREVMDRIHPDDHPPVEAALNTADASGRGLLAYRFRGKDGEYRWLEDHFTVISDSTGRPLYRGGIVRDVTGRRKAEEELTRTHRDLESAHREANLYLDILTHDIGTTENVSNLYADLLFESLNGEAAVCGEPEAEHRQEHRDPRHRIEDPAHSRGTARGRSIDLDAVIRDEIAHFPDLPLRYEGIPRQVLADDLLCEVFTNLIGNAVKQVVPVLRYPSGQRPGRRVCPRDGCGYRPRCPGHPEGGDLSPLREEAAGRGRGSRTVPGRILIDRYGGRIWVEDRVRGHPEEGAAFSFLLREGDGGRRS